MMNLNISLSVIAKLLDNSYSGNARMTGLSIDSRKTKRGDLFVALQGLRFDGHQFLKEAVERGAVALVCHEFYPELSIPQFKVSNTLYALAKIATYYRTKMPCSVIALTGSNGKTSVKEMIAQILPQPAYATPGNLNNEIGVPLSVLELKAEHRYAVFELGANHEGEIARTAAIVQPQVALINNIAPAHIGEFGSIDAIARAKGELFQILPDSGTAVINADDQYAHYWDDILKSKKTLRFSFSQEGDISAKNIHFDSRGCAYFDLCLPPFYSSIQLQIPGKHSIYNALASASCCYALGISLENIVNGLNRFKGVSGRMTYLAGQNDSILVDDTYNANPQSVLAAIDVLAGCPGQRILVLGDMGELGERSDIYHREVGQYAKSKGVHFLITCGSHSQYSSKEFGQGGSHFESQNELVQILQEKLDSNTTVLVKGSRAAAMEKIVQQLISLK